MTHTIERTSQRRRILAPDIARGLALFGIAWANISTAWIVIDPEVPGAFFGGIVNGSIWDQITVVFAAMFVHRRGLPLFALLLGFGIGLITLSLARRGYPPKNAILMLVRRYGLLALFGIVHMIFLFWGDIMYLYGIIAIPLALLITNKDKVILWIAGVAYALWVVAMLFSMFALNFAQSEGVEISQFFDSTTASSYGEWMAEGVSMLAVYTVSLPMSFLSIFPLMAIGFVAARQGVHLDPQRFSRHLTAWIILAVVIILGIGLPWGLTAIGVLPSHLEMTFNMLNETFGYLTGPGIAAAILLACQGMQKKLDDGLMSKLPFPLNMVAALGQRSLSGYLMQSLLLLILVEPFTLNLADGSGVFGLMIISLVVWLITLVLAWILAAAGKPGPFEWLHRRLAYGKDGLQQRWTA